MRISCVVLVAIVLAGCVTSSDVFLADGSEGYNISCGGAVQNFRNYPAKAGENLW
jgi:hypothetical protein